MVFALRRHFAAFHDNNAVGFQYGRQAMGNHQSGATFHQIAERLLHQRFAFCIKCAGSFIEQ